MKNAIATRTPITVSMKNRRAATRPASWRSSKANDVGAAIVHTVTRLPAHSARRMVAMRCAITATLRHVRDAHDGERADYPPSPIAYPLPSSDVFDGDDLVRASAVRCDDIDDVALVLADERTRDRR